MGLHAFSQRLLLPAGSPLGGYAGERLSACESDELEINGFSFIDAATGGKTEVCSVDALYAGDLARAASREDLNRLLVASHTHYAPMLDSGKPQLGAVSTESVDLYRQAIDTAARVRVVPDACHIYRADVAVPIYRRFDVPDTMINRMLTKRAGMYPNPAQPVDRRLYIFAFAGNNRTLFTLVYHACHPVSRHDPSRLSADYIGAVRMAVRERFGGIPCLFMLGCAGDVRPDLAQKRVRWLPRSRFNWRFERCPSAAGEAAIDRDYADAVNNAVLWHSIALGGHSLRIENRKLRLRTQGDVNIPCLTVADSLRFEFVPFEVSHFFHLAAQQRDPMRFIVSCANYTRGYLPHPQQLAAGGYEVDGSRGCMGLMQRTELVDGGLW